MLGNTKESHNNACTFPYFLLFIKKKAGYQMKYFSRRGQKWIIFGTGCWEQSPWLCWQQFYGPG
ncbi:hypothetical protein DESHY_70054 [Desulforamulus hydrothermalis Lam5 = DSM 18033]|uniref:Uncharacterized protein n=1 Tax=Desulforamulus hydrothermalis Lam5 = DSM 18033 TaxID=1121428 RepID=K8EC46_9FIRM|nr:hypothetical protein DESHY_70054 [Desulforamulus hydrothermalis Lam5 = DSM 18033]